MLFSVVIPVYNVKDYLEKCVDSVLAQDCGDYEIILVDDGSTDGVSPELCDRYALASPDRIRVIHQENQGLGGARNTGLEAARGEYLFFVDSDDRIVPHALSYLEGQIRQTHADMYLFRLFYDRDGVLTPADPLRVPTDVVLHPAQCPELLLESPSASVRVCRRSLFLEGQIRFPAGIWYEDLATTPKCLLHARSVVALSEPLYCYLLREGSIMRNANLKRNLEILDVLGSVRAYYESNGVLEQYRAVLSGGGQCPDGGPAGADGRSQCGLPAPVFADRGAGLPRLSPKSAPARTGQAEDAGAEPVGAPPLRNHPIPVLHAARIAGAANKEKVRLSRV